MEQKTAALPLLPKVLSQRCHRIIFVDFDGVLDPLGILADARPPLMPLAIRTRWPQALVHLDVLASVQEGHAEVAVVVTSSWRMYLTGEQLGELLAPIASWYGGPVGLPCQGRATTSAIAIEAWLSLNHMDDYLIQDDQSDYFPGDADAWPTLVLYDSATDIAGEQLQQVHEEFAPLYVLSTSWRWCFERDLLARTLELGGLGFVAQSLPPNWSTPKMSRQAHRSVESKAWHAAHPEYADACVVVDDELSGTCLASLAHTLRKYEVLCQEGVGLQKRDYQRLREALTLRADAQNRSVL